jgi:hypothetical protein
MPDVSAITDEMLDRLVANAKGYTVQVLRPGPNHQTDGAAAIIREHARRNLALRAEGSLAIVIPIGRGQDIVGVGVFDRDLATTREIVEGDPAVAAGILVSELYEGRSFPGDTLPA